MTIAPDRELEELDFPTPEIEHDGNLLLVPQERITVGPIVFTPTEHKAICWDCDKPHDGEVGRCPECAEAFGRARLAAPAVIPPAPTREWADETLEQARRLAQLRRYEERSRYYSTYGDRDWYCYCSPTRSQRLTNSYNGTLARDYERRDRQDALHARRLEAEYHDRLARELQFGPVMRARSWMPGDELDEDTSNAVQAPGGGGGRDWPPRWLCGLVGSGVGTCVGALLALLVL
jgi:hypothetical protein